RRGTHAGQRAPRRPRDTHLDRAAGRTRHGRRGVGGCPLRRVDGKVGPAPRYAEWTGRSDRVARPLLLETARYWTSRCRHDDAGDAHIDAVTGPDEYHERVDDNAYTNVMARWNLRAAADAADR